MDGAILGYGRYFRSVGVSGDALDARSPMACELVVKQQSNVNEMNNPSG
jgi:hypothetical protein